ncbi:MAG: xanthine dehydrogenase family protein molybdopterin-binding subunit [Acidobacteriaceae bacterium]
MATSVIGQAVNRVDGRKKVSGVADYAADHNLDRMVYGYGVSSTIANGRITKMDVSAAKAAEGVLAVYYPGNAPKLYRTANSFEGGSKVGEARPPFEDSQVYYAGQFVALVIADTFEQARYAASLVKVSYEERPPLVGWTEDMKTERIGDNSKRGNPEQAFAQADVKHDETYWTPAEVHNPMEMHGAVAEWRGDQLTVHSSSQGVVVERSALAQMLGVPVANVKVLSPYIGSGFGGKLFMWPQTVLAAAAARELKRPVKLSVTRALMFTTVGHRPATKQRIRLGATKAGKLVSVQHDTVSQTSYVDTYLEGCGETTKALYSCENLGLSHAVTRVNRGTPTPMRAPGSASGLFALESAMDELAVKLKMDPVQLRILNIPEMDESRNKPWSGNHLKECLQTGMERFGWAKRNPEPGSMRDGHEVIGWGMAACSWPAPRGGASARVEILADGTLRVASATQDIGTGTYTIMAQAASSVTGIPVEKIDVRVGDTSLPPGPMSGGSQVTATIMPAVAEASRQALAHLMRVATAKGGIFVGVDPKVLYVHQGYIINKTSGKQATFAQVLQSMNLSGIEGEATTSHNEDAQKYSFRSFGTHFVEVRWDPGISRIRVARTTSVFDAGTIVNEKTARNQITGAVIMGVGMSLFEQSIYDPRTGRVVTNNFADYIVPVHADAPVMDVAFLNIPDLHLNEFGVRGIGELGLTGFAAAAANAVYHATGKRVRDLPITLDKLMA